MAESIFTVGPTTTHVSGGSPITLGTVWRADTDGTVPNLRQFMPDFNSAGAVGLLYSWTSDGLGDQLARKAYTSTIDGVFNTGPDLDMPIAIVNGLYYMAATFFPLGHYVVTAGGLASAITNGHLTAPADDGLTPRHNGKYHDGGEAYPEQTFGSNCYFADVVFVPTPIPPDDPNTYRPSTGRTVRPGTGNTARPVSSRTLRP